jgi:hypothetical protein
MHTPTKSKNTCHPTRSSKAQGAKQRITDEWLTHFCVSICCCCCSKCIEERFNILLSPNFTRFAFWNWIKNSLRFCPSDLNDTTTTLIFYLSSRKRKIKIRLKWSANFIIRRSAWQSPTWRWRISLVTADFKCFWKKQFRNSFLVLYLDGFKSVNGETYKIQ